MSSLSAPPLLLSHLPPDEIFLNNMDGDANNNPDDLLKEVISNLHSVELESPPQSARTTTTTNTILAYECPTDERRLTCLVDELQSPRASTKRFTFEDYGPINSPTVNNNELETRDMDAGIESEAPECREETLVESPIVDEEPPLLTPSPPAKAATSPSWRIMIKRTPESQVLEDFTTIPALSWYCCVMETLGTNVEPLECLRPQAEDVVQACGGDKEADLNPAEEEEDDDVEEENVLYAYGPNNTRLELEMDVDTEMVIGALPTVPEEGESLLSDRDDDFYSTSPRSEATKDVVFSIDEGQETTASSSEETTTTTKDRLAEDTGPADEIKENTSDTESKSITVPSLVTQTHSTEENAEAKVTPDHLQAKGYGDTVCGPSGADISTEDEPQSQERNDAEGSLEDALHESQDYTPEDEQAVQGKEQTKIVEQTNGEELNYVLVNAQAKQETVLDQRGDTMDGAKAIVKEGAPGETQQAGGLDDAYVVKYSDPEPSTLSHDAIDEQYLDEISEEPEQYVRATALWSAVEKPSKVAPEMTWHYDYDDLESAPSDEIQNRSAATASISMSKST